MTDKPGLVAAITAAIYSYMELERKAAVRVGVGSSLVVSPWRHFGRQELMRQRTTMQRRAGRRPS
jgi:hypothetical protein